MWRVGIEAVKGVLSTFKKSILVVVILSLVGFVVFEYIQPLSECRETNSKAEIIMTTLADENNVLKITCDMEKFEDKWANIAKEQNSKREVKNEEINVSIDSNRSTILF